MSDEATCEFEGCSDPSAWRLWVNDASGIRIVDEDVCVPHVMERLRLHPDKEVSWPLGAQVGHLPFRWIRASEALELLENPGEPEPWFPPRGLGGNS